MKILTTAAALAAVLVSAGTAMAVPRTTVPPNTPTQRNQTASNENIREARRHIERAIDRLQRDANDYGGHREAAIDDLGVARQFLDQGLDFRRTHGSRTAVPNTAVPNGSMSGRPVPVTNTPEGERTEDGQANDAGERNENGQGNGNFERGQRASNDNLQFERTQVESAIDALNRDRDDYGGFKERAIDKLQAARSELEAALDFVNRPGVQRGGSGQRVSDANLRFVDEHVQAAIGRLEADRADYGGHRVAAISDLQNAENFIKQALAFDASHPDMTRNTSTAAGVPVSTMGGVPRTTVPTISQGASNDSLADARKHVETAIDALNRDAHDYGGFRVKAIDALQAAREQLLQALNFRKTQ